MTQPGENFDRFDLTKRTVESGGEPPESDADKHRRFMEALGGPAVDKSTEVDTGDARHDVDERVRSALAGEGPTETPPWIPIGADERLHNAVSRYRRDAHEMLLSPSVMGASQAIRDGLGRQVRPRISNLRETIATCSTALTTVEWYLFPKDDSDQASHDEAELASRQLFDASDDYRNFRRDVANDYDQQVGAANKLYEGMTQVDEAATEAKRDVGGVERDYGKHTAAGERALELQDDLKKDGKGAGYALYLSRHVKKVLSETPALALAARERDVYGQLQALHTVLQSIGLGDQISSEQILSAYAGAKRAIENVAAAADAVDTEVSSLIGPQTQKEGAASHGYLGEIEKCIEALRQSPLLGLSGDSQS